MNALAELHKLIDESDWDVKNDSDINKAFQEVNGKLEAAGELDLLAKSEKERQVFAFSKSPDKGLSWRMSGTQTLEDGSEVPFGWPDVNEWKEADFNYIRERFDVCKNLFAKTEYGLVLYYGGYLKQNKEVGVLIAALFDLAKTYLEKAKPEDDKKHYILYFRTALMHALHIAEKRKGDPEISEQYKALIHFTFDTHQSWNVKQRSGLRTAIDLTDFAIDYFKDFSKEVTVEKFLEKNWEAAEYLSTTYTWGAIYVADISIRLCRVLALPEKADKWLYFKAAQFELLAKEALGTKGRALAAIKFVEDALRIYKSLKNQKEEERLEKWYAEIRGKGELGELKQTLPADETKRITKLIEDEVKEKDADGILENFVQCPMFPDVSVVEAGAEALKKDTPTLYLFGSSVLDKFGNTIAIYPSQSDEWAFMQTYSFHFQLGEQMLMNYFIEAYRSGKLTSETTLAYLEKSWMNEAIPRKYARYEKNVIPLDLLRPCIKSFFRETGILFSANPEHADLVTITDSIVLKTEALLRYFFERLELPTFKTKKGHVVMEKNIDDLLGELKDGEDKRAIFDENDRRFIKYILTEKAGDNLRHRVAHGLLDADEYSFEKPVLCFTIILRLSKYKFITKKEEA